ncbi:DEAD/DEAH box helicase [Bradyrhizobium sp. SRS-191]|uniref:DEAD/DEAH box helicase n=1 Tax=Bradyrhizobium sp. SRS-191 TaxID=2962606 RepID=UPI00211E299D|nr:DEAD/DEAH box helicase [Bradyrhizobium sp. SRS-191]
MKSRFEEVISAGLVSVVEAIHIAPRAERLLPIPPEFSGGVIGQWLDKQVAKNGSLWRHQSLALESIGDGLNVVVSTGTASGKSLIFQAAIAKELTEGDGKAIVLYPLKALLSDQLARWKKLAAELGLPENAVAELHGQVLADERIDAVKSARVLVATPDVLQAWFMRQVSAPAFRSLLCLTKYIVLDEAHVYESVFGSNVAYLLRRFLAARRRASREMGVSRHLQIIAATATIADPCEHLEKLTGWPFAGIGEDEDGAPTFGRTLYHIEGPDTSGPAESFLSDLISRVISGTSTDGSFIAFHNSRQGVERIARSIDQDDVLPYRSGYELDDRAKIERALRSGALRGVISTSALELGIDVAQFRLGLNLGVPQSKKAFRQRLGRVGRAAHGCFAVIAPRLAFARYGTSFQDYYDGSVEPSHLYLSNRFIQFAHARCLVDESESLGNDTKGLPPGVSWPESFEKVYEVARPGARRPREFDYIAQLGADSPHYNYPLRQVGEASYKIREGSKDFSESIGDIALNQAIREAYPGALYLHLRRPTKVVEWRSSSFDRTIRIESARSMAPTRPILKKTVNVSLNPEEIVAGRLLTGTSGAIAEINVQVNESVEGFSIGGKSFLYRDLRSQDPRMTRKQREFRSTGVLIKISEPWFAGTGPQANTRSSIAEGLKQLLLREKSISPNDIDCAHTNIAFYVDGAPRRATDTIVIYDSIYGGLRLTEPLYAEFRDYLAMLEKGAQLAGQNAFIDTDTVSRLRDWFNALAPGVAAITGAPVAADGEYLIYAPGSEVALLHQGVLVDRVLRRPKLMPMGESIMLMYSYENGNRGGAWIPHDQIQAIGQNWHYAFWNPVTDEIRDADAADGAF